MERKKRNAVIRIVVCAIIIAALISVLMAGIRGHVGFPFISINFGGNSYSNADKYTSGDITYSADSLDELYIDWVSGDIQIEVYEGDVIDIYETESEKLSKEDRVHSYFEDGVLRIQYRKAAAWGFSFREMNKDLHIRIPRKLNDADKILDEMSIDNVSANITINDIHVDNYHVDTVSGDVTFTGNLRQLNIEAVSGSSYITSGVTPENINTDTVSGEVTLTVPADSKFAIDFDSVSGDLTNAFPTLSDDKENEWEFESVSGDVSIQSLQ